MPLLDPHPALKAAVPVNPVGDLWMGDDYFHNGAFRLSFAVEYLYRMGTRADAQLAMAFSQSDLYSWFLQAGSARDIDARYFDQRQAFWKLVIAHSSYDTFWQQKAMAPLLAASHAPSVPTLNIHGWFDQEDLYGSLATYAALERREGSRSDELLRSRPVVSRASLGKRRRHRCDALGRGHRQTLGAKTSWRRFLRITSKMAPRPGLAKATVFETGTNRWRRFDAWPPRGLQSRNLYLAAGQRTGWTAPQELKASDSYVSDPSKPSTLPAAPGA